MRIPAMALAVLAGIAMCLATPGAALAGPSLVFDAQSGKVIHESDADAPWFPASLTKLMTAYVTFGALKSGRLALDQKIACSARAHAQPPSKLGLPVGASISVEMALKLIIVKSANDVAVMLAEAVSGSVDAFAAEMNAIAGRLGMSGSHFVNPHGLPDIEQVTTARDMGLLAQALIRDFPEYYDWFALEQVRFGKITIRTHNSLLRDYPGAEGMKTGYICAAGYNLVASARRGERRLVAVVLGAASGKARAETASGLLEMGFNGGRMATLMAPRLDDAAARTAGAALPHHMGPTVCKRRYGERDPYAVDATLREQAEARRVEALAVSTGTGVTGTLTPLPPRRPAGPHDPS